VRRVRARPREPEGRDRWLISYADFVTLLFAVFTPLYAISTVDAQRADALVLAIEESFDRQPRGLLPGLSEADAEHQHGASLRERAFDLARELGESGGVQTRESSAGLVLSLADAVFFETGADTLRPQSAEALAQIAALVVGLPNHVRVEGHSDNQRAQGARAGTHWQLSSERAVQVVTALEQAGVPAHRLSASGFGAERPLVSNETAEGRSLNRRVDIVILH